MLVKVENGIPTQWPVAETHVQATNPNTSFSFPLNDAVLKRFGYGVFVHSDPATHDGETQEPQEIAPILKDGKWVQQWKIVEKFTPEEKATYLAKKAARLAEAAANAYKFARAIEYPSVGDQLDALFHAGLFPADLAAKIQAVKDKYPKV